MLFQRNAYKIINNLFDLLEGSIVEYVYWLFLLKYHTTQTKYSVLLHCDKTSNRIYLYWTKTNHTCRGDIFFVWWPCYILVIDYVHNSCSFFILHWCNQNRTQEWASCRKKKIKPPFKFTCYMVMTNLKSAFLFHCILDGSTGR